MKFFEDHDNELAAAARDGDMKELESRLSKGANPNRPNEAGGLPISLAAESGHEHIVKCLLHYGADPDPHGELIGKKTALMRAATKGNIRILELLLEAGSDPDILDSNGQTALIWAAAYGQTEAVRILLVRGADPSVVDSLGGNTAYDVAEQLGFLEICTEMALHGAMSDRESKDDVSN